MFDLLDRFFGHAWLLGCSPPGSAMVPADRMGRRCRMSERNRCVLLTLACFFSCAMGCATGSVCRTPGRSPGATVNTENDDARTEPLGFGATSFALDMRIRHANRNAIRS